VETYAKIRLPFKTGNAGSGRNHILQAKQISKYRGDQEEKEGGEERHQGSLVRRGSETERKNPAAEATLAGK